MAALDIKPHSRRISGMAIVGLSVLAVGAFASGLARQASSVGPAPFPGAPTSAYPGPAAADGGLAVGAIPLATPAPVLQTADATPVRHAPATDPAAAPDAPAADPAAAATPPALDASAATAAAEPAAPPAPAPQNQPPRDDPPT